MNKTVAREYKRLRQVGFNARDSLRTAKLRLLWDKLETAGLVRLNLVPDECPDLSYIDLPENKRWARREWETVNRDGVWGLCGEYRINPDSSWKQADSIWGLIGTDYKDNGYDSDIMAQTIKELRKALKGRCPCCRQVR